MQAWDGWPVERMIYAFLGAAWLLIWLQVSLYHWRAGFHSKFMWGPVLFTPLLVLISLVLAAAPRAATVFAVLYGLGVIEGLAGTALHLRGVGARVGGFSLSNLMSGPPVLLAVTYAALCGLGLLVLYRPQLLALAD